MARRSLRPQLNQIRTWVRQGRTDAWIAHQLEVPVKEIDAFKRSNDLLADGEESTGGATDFDDEIDLRAEDDAQIAAELEAEAEARAAAEAEAAAKAAAEPAEEDGDEDAKPRRRGRRGGRTRRGAKGRTVFEGAFDHGEEGYGLWLDPEVADSAVYAEHWAGHRDVEITVEEDQIVIRRAGEPADADDAAS